MHTKKKLEREDSDKQRMTRDKYILTDKINLVYNLEYRIDPVLKLKACDLYIHT